MERVLHETCQQYVARRLSEGWKIVGKHGEHSLILSPPDGSFLRTVDLRNDVETLRPSGDGATTTLSTNDSAFNHYENVDEVSTDEDTTFNYGNSDGELDLYTLPAHSAGSGTINHVTVYFRVKAPSGNRTGRAIIRTHSTNYVGDTETITSSWVTLSHQWATNPNTSDPWTWDEVDALEAGYEAVTATAFYVNRVTQVYVEVDYTPVVAVPRHGFVNFQNPGILLLSGIIFNGIMFSCLVNIPP